MDENTSQECQNPIVYVIYVQLFVRQLYISKVVKKNRWRSIHGKMNTQTSLFSMTLNRTATLAACEAGEDKDWPKRADLMKIWSAQLHPQQQPIVKTDQGVTSPGNP